MVSIWDLKIVESMVTKIFPKYVKIYILFVAFNICIFILENLVDIISFFKGFFNLSNSEDPLLMLIFGIFSFLIVLIIIYPYIPKSQMDLSIDRIENQVNNSDWFVISLKLIFLVFSCVTSVIFFLYPYQDLFYFFNFTPNYVQQELREFHMKNNSFPFIYTESIFWGFFSCLISPLVYFTLYFFIPVIIELTLYRDNWILPFQKDKEYLTITKNRDFSELFDVSISGDAFKKEIFLYEILEIKLTLNSYKKMMITAIEVKSQDFTKNNTKLLEFPFEINKMPKTIQFDLIPQNIGENQYEIIINGHNEEILTKYKFLNYFFRLKEPNVHLNPYKIKVNPPPPRLVIEPKYQKDDHYNETIPVQLKIKNRGKSRAYNITCTPKSTKKIDILQDFLPIKFLDVDTQMVERKIVVQPLTTGEYSLTFDIQFYDEINNLFIEKEFLLVEFSYSTKEEVKSKTVIVSKMTEKNLRFNFVENKFNLVIDELKKKFPISQEIFEDVFDILKEKLATPSPYEYRDYYGKILSLLAEKTVDLNLSLELSSLAKDYMDDHVGNRYQLEKDCIKALIILSEVWKPEITLSEDVENRIEEISQSDYDFSKINLLKWNISKIKKLRTYIEENNDINDKEPEDISSKEESKKICKIFISYAREDSAYAERLYINFQKFKNIDIFLDQKNILPGDNWKDIIYNAIENCHYIILILSSNSVTKTGFVQKEFKFAIDRYKEFPPGKRYLLPVKVDDCTIPYRELKDVHIEDLHRDWNFGFARLVKAIRKEFNI